MDETQLTDIKNTYYEYVSNISVGCEKISLNLRKNQLEEAFSDIADFAEGLQWLITVEKLMSQNNFEINSTISEAKELMNDINDSLESQDYVLLADLFEYELSPLFSSSSEWLFIKG